MTLIPLYTAVSSMKRKGPLLLFLSCWLLVLLVPPLRQMAWIQISGQSNFQNGWRELYDIDLYEEYGAKADVLASRFPDNVDILAVQAGEKSDSDAKSQRYGRVFDPLIHRFPQHSWLIARRLQVAIAQMRDDRVGGELSDPYLDQSKALGIASPERTKEKPNFTPAELEEVLALARLGQKREPDNGFYDWIEASFLLSTWRDAEAWRALSRGSHKPRFDNHSRESLRAIVTAHHAYKGRPLLWEEKYLLRYGPIDTFSVNAQTREMGRVIGWEAIKSRRRGQHEKSLRIRSDFLRLMEKASRQSYTFIDQMVFLAMPGIALGDLRPENIKKKIKAISSDEPHFHEKRACLRAPYYDAYMKAHARPDLAREMGQLLLQGAQRQDALLKVFKSAYFHSGVETRPLIRSEVLWASAALMLLILPLLSAWWLLLGSILRWARVPSVNVEMRETIRPVVLISAAVIFCFATAFYFGAIWNTLLYIVYRESGPAEYYDETVHGLLALGVLLPGILATFLCWRQTRPEKVLLSWRERLHQKLSELRLSSLLLDVWLHSLLWAAALWWGASLQSYWGAPWIAQVAFGIALFLLWLRWIFGAAPQEKPVMARRLRLLHSTLGTLLVVGSLAYCLLLIVSLPLRARADEQMNQLIERGEVALMLENYSALPKTR